MAWVTKGNLKGPQGATGPSMAPATITGTTTNSSGATHSHALTLVYNATDLAALSSVYPTAVPSIGQVTVGPNGAACSHITWNASSIRVAQLISSVSGGTGVPDLWFRTSHDTVGGGGWTAAQKIWHDGLSTLEGNKSANGAWTFYGTLTSKSTVSPAFIVERTNAVSNCLIQYTTTGGSVFAGASTGSVWAVGGTNNLLSVNWLAVSSSGITVTGDVAASGSVNGLLQHRLSAGYMLIGSYNVTTYGSGYCRVWWNENAKRLTFNDATELAISGATVLTTASSVNAATLSGLSVSFSNVGNTIPQRNSSGDIVARLFRSEYPNESSIAATSALIFRNSTTDNYMRACDNPASVVSWLNLAPMSITVTGGTLVQRHASGYIYANYFNSTSGFTSAAPTAVWVETGSDGFLRKQTVAALVANLPLDSTNVPMVINLVPTSGTLSANAINKIAEKAVAGDRTYTIPAGLGVPGSAITFMNSNSGNITIARGSGVSLYRNSVNANIVVPTGSMLTIVKSSNGDVWVA